MTSSLNLKLYFLLTGLFLIFNLSCEDQDLTIADLGGDTLTYTLSLTSSVCNPACSDDLVDYNDETVIEYTVVTAELMSFPVDDITGEILSSDSSPVSGANIICTNGIGYSGVDLLDPPELIDISSPGSNAFTTNSDGTISLQWSDKGIIGTFNIECYYDGVGERFYSDEPIDIEVHSVYEKVESLSSVLDTNNPDNIISFNLDNGNLTDQVTVKVEDENGNGVPGIEVYIDIPNTDDYIISSPATTSSSQGSLGEAVLNIEVIETIYLQNLLESNGTYSTLAEFVIQNEYLDCDACVDNTLSGTNSIQVDIQKSGQTCEDIHEIKFINFPEEFELDSGNLAISTKVLNEDGNAISGIEVELKISSMTPSEDFIEGIPDGQQITQNGIVTHTINALQSNNPSILAPLDITASIPCSENEDGEPLYSVTETMYVGNLFAINTSQISSLDLYLDTNPLILDGTSNSVTMNAIIRDSDGSAVDGVPVRFSATPSNYGVFADNNIISSSGTVNNTLANIQTSNPSIMESIIITASIDDPANQEGTSLFESSVTLQVGDLFAIYNADVSSVDLVLDATDNTLILDGITNSVSMQAIVKNPNGTPVEGIPVSFATTAEYGTFSMNNVLSGSDGVATNILQNINTSNPSIMENIPIVVSILNAENQSVVAQDTETLKVGDLFALNIENINSLSLSLNIDNNTLLLDGTSNSVTMQVSVKDANGNPLEGIPVIFSNTSDYGIFTNNNVLSVADGTANNTLQNIETPNASIMEQIPITVSILDPSDESVIVTDMQTLQVGDLFAQNIGNVKSLDLLLSSNPLILDLDGTSVTMEVTVRDGDGNPIEGIPVNFTNGSAYGTFSNTDVISGSNGVVTNVLNLNNISNPEIIENIFIKASVINPEDGTDIESDTEILQAGNQMAFTMTSINEVDLIVVGSESLILGLENDSDSDGEDGSENNESENSFIFRATVRDANGNPVEGVPVSFINASNYGTFTTTETISGSDGVATNTLQNIVTPDPSILESITITARIFDPSDGSIILFNDEQVVFVGNQFAYSFDDISSVNLLTDNEPLIIEGLSNSITLQAVVSNADGSPVEGVPVYFSNASIYGVFTSNNVVSGNNGIVQNTLQNIDIPNPSIMTDIEITVSVLNPEDNSTVATDSETLQVGNLFAQNIDNINEINLVFESDILVLDGTSNSMEMGVVVSDANGNPLEGIPVNFSNTSDYGTFIYPDNLLSAEDGTVLNTLQNIDPDDYDIIESIPIIVSVFNPEDGTIIANDSKTLYTGNLFAFNMPWISTIDLLLSTNSLTLGESNSVTMQATVRGDNGDPIPGIPVSFSTTSEYGTFLTNDVLSGDDGRVTNTLQNIDTPNPSIMENIPITVSITNPEDDSTIATETENLEVGDLFAQNINTISELDLALSDNPLILGGVSNSVTLQVTVRDNDGNPVEGIPVNFVNTSSYGTFSTNDVLSGSDGIAVNILQNINTPNPSVMENITIIVSVFDPQDGASITTETETLQVGDMFAQNIDDINSIILMLDDSIVVLDDTSENSTTMLAVITDATGNPLEGIPVTFTSTYDYGAFEQSESVISGSNGIVSNTFQNIWSSNPATIASIDIDASILDPENGSAIATVSQIIYTGNQIAFSVSAIDEIDLIVDGSESLVLGGTSDSGSEDEEEDVEGSGNTFTFRATVRDADGNPVEGVPVSFTNSSNYGTFTTTETISGSDGVAMNILQNIATDDPSVLETITITATVFDPSDDTILFSDNQVVFVGNQFAYNFGEISSITLSIETNPLILDAGTDSLSTTNNSVTMLATVRDPNGNPVSGVPVNFINTSNYGTFTNNGLISGSDGVVNNTLQNIDIGNPSEIANIEITVSIFDPLTEQVVATATETLQVGNQFAFNYTDIDNLYLVADVSNLIINDIGDSLYASQTNAGSISVTASVNDDVGNPVEGIFINFFNNSDFGTFNNNGGLSSNTGTVSNTLQNISLEYSETGIEDIELYASIDIYGEEENIISNTLTINTAYQSALNIAKIADLDVALEQFLETSNNVNIIHKDTVIVNVQDALGVPVADVPVFFELVPGSNCTGDDDIMGYINDGLVWTDGEGKAQVQFTLTAGDLLECADQIINTSISVYISDEFQDTYSWAYEVEGVPNIEYDVNIFEIIAGGNITEIRDKFHLLTFYGEDGISNGSFRHQTIDTVGILLEGAQVHYEMLGNGGDFLSVEDKANLGLTDFDFGIFEGGVFNGELYESTGITCYETLQDTLCHCGSAEIDSTGTLDRKGVACNEYLDRAFPDQPNVDIIRAYIPDPQDPSTILGNADGESLLDTLMVISIPPSNSAFEMNSFPFPQTILMDSLDVVYCDTITTIVTNINGVSLANVPINYAVNTDDQQYGTLSAYADTTGPIPGVIYNAARTVFCTYPNITLDDDPTIVNIEVTAPNTDPILTNDVAINLVEDLPECPDCEASLTLTSQYYELPTGDDNEIVTTQITATVIDTTENPVPPFTLVEFESVTLDADGNLVPNGSIEPYKFTDENGQAVATFNMETDVGLTQIIGTAPSYNLADTIYINLTSTDATSIQLVPPTPNEITVQGGGGIEATQIAMEIKDGSDNLVTEPFLVHYRILPTAPVGVYLNDQDENYFVECAESSNGQATVTLNSGSQPGSVPIRAELYPADLGVECTDIDEATYNAFGIASLESVPVTVVTGAPAFGQINYSYVEISPIGGGQYELPLSVSLWDFYSNPVADSTNVYIWIEGIADPWSVDSVYTFGDSVKWGGVDATGQVIEVDSLVYVWNNEDFDSTVPGNPEPGSGLEIFEEPLWREIQHPGSIIGAAETGMESPDGISYPGIAWSSVRFGTASVFENTVIKALCYDADGEKLIIDGRDSHDGDGLVLPCYNCVLTDPGVNPGFVDFSLIGDVGLNDLDDTVEVTIGSSLTDYYQYPVNNGTLQAVATGASFLSVCDPADTDLDGFTGCCNSFDVQGGTGTGDGDGVCDVESPFLTCTDCVANGGAWIPDSAQDDPSTFTVEINGPNDAADDPAFGNTNGNGGVVWTVSYSELLNIGDNNDPESYDSWPSQITIFLLDPLQVTSSTLTYEIFKTEQNDNP